MVGAAEVRPASGSPRETGRASGRERSLRSRRHRSGDSRVVPAASKRTLASAARALPRRALTARRSARRPGPRLSAEDDGCIGLVRTIEGDARTPTRPAPMRPPPGAARVVS